jgi:hypothetical protein
VEYGSRSRDEIKLEHRGISREDPLARKSHTRRREATLEEWMNANLELTISYSTARGATIAMAWEIMEIAVAPMIEKKICTIHSEKSNGVKIEVMCKYP